MDSQSEPDMAASMPTILANDQPLDPLSTSVVVGGLRGTSSGVTVVRGFKGKHTNVIPPSERKRRNSFTKITQIPPLPDGKEVDLMVTARYIVTAKEDAPNEFFMNGSIVVHAGKIVDIIAENDTERRSTYNPKEVIYFPDHGVFPGFVNAHTHLPMSLIRGFAEDLSLSEWLSYEIWPLEAQFVSYDFCYDGAELAAAELLRGGTTCVNDMYFFPEATATVLKKVGMRGLVSSGAIDFPSNYASSFDEYYSKTEGLLKQQIEDPHPLVRYSVAAHAPYTVCDEHLEKHWKLAEKYNSKFSIHLHETQGEVDDSETLTKSFSCHRSTHKLRPMKNFERMGLVGERLIAIHMTQVSDEEAQILAQTNSNVIHCPESNLKLVAGTCPAWKLIDSGVNVGLGTDGSASNNDLSMMGEMKTAGILGKWIARDASAMPVHAILQMATLNGARALGLEEEIGSLEIGKSADFIAVDFSSIERSPVYDPISALVYSSNDQQVTDVWIAGKRVLNQRHFANIDEDDLRQRVEKWHEKIIPNHASQRSKSTPNLPTTDKKPEYD